MERNIFFPSEAVTAMRIEWSKAFSREAREQSRE